MLRWRSGLPRSTVVTIASLVAAFWCFYMASAGAQTQPPASAAVRITGKVERPLVIGEADLRALPHKRLTVTDDKGAVVRYEGVPAVELLRRAGAPLGKQLKGVGMRLYVVVEASDGYHVVFALPEFDPAFTDRVIILADRRDGHVMASPEGPFRLVVPDEKRHARWVREVTVLDVEEAQ